MRPVVARGLGLVLVLLLVLVGWWLLWRPAASERRVVVKSRVAKQSSIAVPSSTTKQPAEHEEQVQEEESENTFVVHVSPGVSKQSDQIMVVVCGPNTTSLDCHYENFQLSLGRTTTQTFEFSISLLPQLYTVKIIRMTMVGHRWRYFEILTDSEGGVYELDAPDSPPYNAEKEEQFEEGIRQIRGDRIARLDEEIDAEEDPVLRARMETFRMVLTGEMVEVAMSSGGSRAAILDLVQEAKELHGVTEPIYQEEVTWLEEGEY